MRTSSDPAARRRPWFVLLALGALGLLLAGRRRRAPQLTAEPLSRVVVPAPRVAVPAPRAVAQTPRVVPRPPQVAAPAPRAVAQTPRVVPRPPQVAAPAPRAVAVRARRTLWGTGVVLVSAIVGLLAAAGIYALVHGSSATSSFATAVPAPAGHFALAAATGGATLPPGVSLAASVHGDHIAVYRHPGGRHPHRLDALTVGGKPVRLVLLVERRRPGWLKVELPVRPNLGTGWIRAAGVTLHSVSFHVVADVRTHRLTVWDGTRVLERLPIGVGESVSPTPSGRYYITDLLRPPNPAGLYGPYAFGLSAYSDVYTSFAGGNGEIGLHGTDDPAGIGHDVSHGCIRLTNVAITRLAKLLPLGTPVTIER